MTQATQNRYPDILIRQTFFHWTVHSKDRVRERGEELVGGSISYAMIRDVIRFGACYHSAWIDGAFVLTAKLKQPVYYENGWKDFVFVVVKPEGEDWNILTTCYTCAKERERSGIGSRANVVLPWRNAA